MHRKGKTPHTRRKFGREECCLGTTMDLGTGRTDFRALANQVLLLSVATRMREKRTDTLEERQTGNPETSIKSFSLRHVKPRRAKTSSTQRRKCNSHSQIVYTPKFLATTSTRYVCRSFSNCKSNSEPIN
jgi:hypothetical protein